jgi:hypothetical protein
MKNWLKIGLSALPMLVIGHCCQHYNTLAIKDLKIMKIRDTTTVAQSAQVVLKDNDTSGFQLDTLPQTDGFIELNWQMLAKTTFKPLSIDSLDGLIVLMPKFPNFMHGLAGKNVMMRGFVIPIEETGDLQALVLSANSYTTCFFCGQAGPESVMDIRLKNPKSVKRFKKDEKIIFRGQLKLNDKDFNYFN